MIKKFIYHLFLIIVLTVVLFAGHFFYTKYVINYASNNSEKPVKEDKIEQPIYLTKAPKCQEINGIELSWGFAPPKNYSGWAKYCSDSTGNVLAHGGVLNGEFNGVWINYNENGSFSDERLWIHGKLEGKMKKYLDGEIALLGQFVNDEAQGEWKYYNDGELSSIGKYINGKKQGEWKYYEDGELRSIGKYINGKKQGEWKYYEDGELSSIGKYVNDEAQGEWKYYNDGELSLIGKYFNDEAQGEWKYYNDGELSSIGKYINGKLEGKWKKYHTDGSLKRVETWKNDELQSCEGECDDD